MRQVTTVFTKKNETKMYTLISIYALLPFVSLISSIFFLSLIMFTKTLCYLYYRLLHLK